MASNSRSCRNAQPTSAGLKQLEKAPIEITPIPSTANALSQASTSVSAPAVYTQEDL